MNHKVKAIHNLKMFVDSINDLSADLILDEALHNYYVDLYKEKIEEALITKDKAQFETYTQRLKDMTQ